MAQTCCTELSASLSAEKKGEILVKWTQRTYDSAAMRMARSILAQLRSTSPAACAAYFTLAGTDNGRIRTAALDSRGVDRRISYEFRPYEVGVRRELPGNTGCNTSRWIGGHNPPTRSKGVSQRSYWPLNSAAWKPRCRKGIHSCRYGRLRRRVASTSTRCGVIAGVMFPHIGGSRRRVLLNRLSAAFLRLASERHLSYSLRFAWRFGIGVRSIRLWQDERTIAGRIPGLLGGIPMPFECRSDLIEQPQHGWKTRGRTCGS